VKVPSGGKESHCCGCCVVGDPSENHCYADVDAAYDYLRHELGVPAQNIVLYGRSLGSGPSCYLASKTASLKKTLPDDGPVGGVILHAPFLSVYRVVIDTGCTVYGDKFPNIDFAPMINSPVILVHGRSDQIVPFHHSERLFQALQPSCQAKPLFIDGMGHNNVHAEVRPMFVERLSEFLSQHIRPSGGYCGPRRALSANKGKRPNRQEAEDYARPQIA
jgi:abhydrolase domain-containing protein 17